MVNIKSFEVENKISLAFSWESLALIWEEGPPFQFEWMECSILHPNLILSFWLKREIKIPHNAIFNSYLSTSHIQEIIKSIIDYSHGICHNPITARDSLTLLCELWHEYYPIYQRPAVKTNTWALNEIFSDWKMRFVSYFEGGVR